MLETKLTKIRDLINEKERIEGELAVLLGEAERPKRGRPRATLEKESPQPKESSDG